MEPTKSTDAPAGLDDISQDRSSTETLVADLKLTTRSSWGKSNRAVAYLAAVAALRVEDSEPQESVTDSRQYDEIMDRFQVRLRHSNSEKSLQRTNSGRSDKVLSAGDTARSSFITNATLQSFKDFNPANVVESLPISSEPKESGAEVNRLTTDESPLHLRLVETLAEMAATASQRLLTPISPYSAISRVRSALLVLACSVYAVAHPVELAFYSTPLQWLNTTGKAVDVMLLLDAILMFNTSFVDKRGAVVTQRWEIVAHYLKGSFLSDVLASIGIYWLQSTNNQHRNHVTWYFFLSEIVCLSYRLLHLLHALHLAWFGHAGRSGKSIWNWFLYSRYSHLLRISWIIGLVLLLSHYMACFWKLLEVNAANSSVDFFDDYTANLYGALQLLQGQGLPTVTVGQNLFASFAVLAGSVVLAIVFGHMAMLVSNFNANTTNYQRKMESVFAITTKMQLPGPLRERIHQYYEHLWREYDSLDGEIVNFSKDLTSNLTLEVVLFKYMVLVMHVPFWRECGVDFQKQIALHLIVRVYLPDDFIIRRGEVDDELYVINRGFCEMESDPDSFEHGTAPLRNQADEVENSCFSGGRQSETTSSGRNKHTVNDPDFYPQRPPFKNLAHLSRGQAFGELALLMNYERTVNVRAVSHVEMCVLTRSAFQAVMRKYPKDRRLVILQILTTFVNRNEAKRGLCPLKRMVHSVVHKGDSSIRLSTQRAVQLIADVIDPKLQDESTMFSMDENLVQQLAAQKIARQSDFGISQALDARLQQIEEARVQTAELFLAEMKQIEAKLAQVMQIAQDHMAGASDTTQNKEPQPENFRTPPQFGVRTSNARRAHAPAAVKRSFLTRTIMPESERISPETKRRYLLRTNSSPLVRVRSRSSSVTHMQSTSIAEDHPLVHSPEHEVEEDKIVSAPRPKPMQRRNSSFAGAVLPNGLGPQSKKKQLRRTKSGRSFDRASELIGRILPYHFSSASPVQSPTAYADQLFRASRPSMSVLGVND